MARLIVIEGIDGSGKGTQTQLLKQPLESAGQRVATLSFPRYDATFFGVRVADFLNGRFGTLDDVPPFLAALLYAGDRFESRDFLLEAMLANDVVLLDRYVTSNIAHQAGKRTGEERSRLVEWIEHLEYQVYALPRPDRVLLLDISAADAQQLIARKQQRSYTSEAADLQEANATYLEQVRQAYLTLARGAEWRVIPVCASGAIRPLSDITQSLWEAAQAQG